MDARTILRLSRAHFLIPGILLYILGALTAMAGGIDIDPLRLLLGYTIFGTAHLAVSFSNDYFDRETDMMGTRTPVSGGSGVLQEHPELERMVLVMAVLLTLASICLVVLFMLIFQPPWWFLLFVIAGNALVWSYSAPPVRLASRGWGEAATALAAGLLMPGMGYLVVSGTIDAWFLTLSLPLLCYGLFFIISVELPDVESDKLSGKDNMLVRMGRDFGLIVGATATAMGTVLLIIIAIMGILDGLPVWGFVILSFIPLAAGMMGVLMKGMNQKMAVRQVKVNFGALVLFVLCSNLLILGQMV